MVYTTDNTMNISQFKTKLLFYLLKKSSVGFTLIELMVVMIFLSLFAAIALPNLVKQAGKAREVEFKNAVGTINRAQQAYHWENNVFVQETTDAESINVLNLSFDNTYIEDYNIVAYNNSSYAVVRPSNTDFQQDQTRAYAGGVYYSQGNYSMIVCQSYEVTNIIAEPSDTRECGSDAEQIR